MNGPIEVVRETEETEGVVEAEFDPTLYEQVCQAIERASWHGSEDGWVDGYVHSFALPIMYLLHEKYELRRNDG